MDEYIKQAEDFLEKTGSTLSITYLGHEVNENWRGKQYRDRYEFTLSVNGESYTADFWQSVAGAGVEPTSYDILACLGHYVEDDFEDFCAEFGYDDLKLSEYPRIKAIHEACLEEYNTLTSMYSEEEMEMLNEIQ